MSTYANRYAQQIIDILTPLIGQVSAKGALVSQCKKIDVLPEALSRSNLPQIAEGIKKILVMFIGSDGADIIVNQIKEITKRFDSYHYGKSHLFFDRWLFLVF